MRLTGRLQTTRNRLVCATTSILETGLSVLCHDICVKYELCTLGKLVLHGYRIVIPQSLQKAVLKLGHEGHQGMVKTKSRLRQKCGDLKWIEMWSECAEGFMAFKSRDSIHHPNHCRRRSHPRNRGRMAVNLMGPLPGGENLLVDVDYYSRFFELVVMKSTTTHRIIAALMDIFARFGFPYILKTDNGAQFVGG